MPDMSSVPAGVPAEDYSDFINTQRQQMLAQALMSSSLQPIQQPETSPVKGLYVQPRVGAAQAASKIAEALMGKSATNKALQSQIALQQKLNQAYTPGGQQTSPGVPLQAAPAGTGSNAEGDDQGVQPAIARAPGQSLATTVQQTQPTLSPVNPRNPQGLPADVVRQLAMTDPAKYAAMLQGPESVQLARLGGQDPASAARAALSKQTQTEVRPGATVLDPISGRTMIGADPSKGEYYAVGPDGQVHAYPITNDATIQALRTGLTTAATQANTPHYEADPFHPGQVNTSYPPTPPALRTQQPVAAPPAGPPGAAPAAGPAPGSAPGAAAPASVPPSGTPRPPGATQPPATPAPPAPPAPRPARAANTAADLEQQKKGATGGQDYASELAKNATGATEVRRSLSELTNLASQATPAANNEAKMKLGSYMLAAGASPQTVSGFLGVDVGALQAAQKQTATLAVNTIHSMTSRGTNFDLDTFMRNNPNTNMADPAAFSRVVQYMDNKAQQEIAKQKDFSQWSKGVSPDQWETGHTAHWLEMQNAAISKGQSNSTNPNAAPRAYASAAEAQAAATRGEIKAGDRIKVGDQTGTWH